MSIVVGLVGETGAGKGVVSNMLIDRGFHYFSTSDELRTSFLTKYGKKEQSREDLRIFGNQTRREYNDPAIFVRSLLQNPNFLQTNIAVVDGLRNIHELAALRSIGSVINTSVRVVAVTALPEVRYLRLLDRAKESDPLDWSTFCSNDLKEQGDINDPYALHLPQCIEASDIKIVNNFQGKEAYRLLSIEVSSALLSIFNGTKE
jgi:dephospho-CoA kinase